MNLPLAPDAPTDEGHNPSTSLVNRLDALRAAGAGAYDPPGLRFIEALLSRAEALTGEAATRLQARAAARLELLAARLAEDRTAAEAVVQTLAAAGADPAGVYAEAFAAGDHRRILREAEVALARTRTEAGPTEHDRLARLCDQARAQGLEPPPALRAALADPAPEPARQAADQLAQALFRRIAQATRGTVAVARAHDRLPAEVGPYNPTALAGQALAAIEALAPAWLATVLACLEDVGTLQALPAPPERAHARRRR